MWLLHSIYLNCDEVKYFSKNVNETQLFFVFLYFLHPQTTDISRTRMQ